MACLWSTYGRRESEDNEEKEEKRRRGCECSMRCPDYLYGEAVRHHHDDQRDEEGYKGADQHEALLVEDTATVDEDLILVVEADHWDRHRHT